jgi:tetratricopeptide (TPR) repeat protein
MTSKYKNLERSVRREETLRYETVKQIWDEEVKSNNGFVELAQKGEDTQGKTKSSGCCGGSSKKRPVISAAASKRNSDKQAELDLIKKVDNVNGDSRSANDLVDNFEAVFRAKQRVYELDTSPNFATLLNTTGLIYYCLDEFEKAVEYLQRSLQQRRALAGSNQTNESVAESYNNLV